MVWCGVGGVGGVGVFVVGFVFFIVLTLTRRHNPVLWTTSSIQLPPSTSYFEGLSAWSTST